jgi:hypothetical protein
MPILLLFLLFAVSTLAMDHERTQSFSIHPRSPGKYGCLRPEHSPPPLFQVALHDCDEPIRQLFDLFKGLKIRQALHFSDYESGTYRPPYDFRYKSCRVYLNFIRDLEGGQEDSSTLGELSKALKVIQDYCLFSAPYLGGSTILGRKRQLILGIMGNDMTR